MTCHLNALYYYPLESRRRRGDAGDAAVTVVLRVIFSLDVVQPWSGVPRGRVCNCNRNWSVVDSVESVDSTRLSLIVVAAAVSSRSDSSSVELVGLGPGLPLG